MVTLRAIFIGMLLAASTPAASWAQAKSSPPDLLGATLEDLMNMEITSASRKEQRLGDVPAAITVLTHDDIRRSGMTTLPELLRLVPGVQVARINSNKWAVAVRGFNNLFADKLLVLIDGRTVYDRLNSGVFWESLDIPLDEIERIEVVRGAGGASWGANAMNGVISIITKSAADTPGAAASAGAGAFDGLHGAFRYGGVVGSVAYRLSTQWSGHGESRIDADTDANDAWQSQSHGARLDWSHRTDAVMVQAGATIASLRGLWPAPAGPVPAVSPRFRARFGTQEYNVLGRWTRRRDSGASFQVQSFIDYRHNDDLVNPRQFMADVDAQYHAAVWRGHDLVAGAGYRHLEERVDGSFAFSIQPAQVGEAIASAFAQDDIALGPRVTASLGARVDHHSTAGWSLQPTARLMWSIVPQRQQLWAAISRAVRNASLGDTVGRFNYTSFVGQGGLPVVVGALGNPDLRSEEVVDTEVGYRVESGSAMSLDVTAYRGSYDKLKTSEPLAPRLEAAPGPAHLFIPAQFANLLEATTTGIEIAAHATPFSWWRLDGSYSTFHLAPHRAASSGDVAALTYRGNAPRAQWQARSGFVFPSRVRLDALMFHSGVLSTLGVAAYTRADVQLEVPLTSHFTLFVVGQNLLDPVHAEYAGVGAIVGSTLIPRSARLQVSWRF